MAFYINLTESANESKNITKLSDISEEECEVIEQKYQLLHNIHTNLGAL